MLYDAITAVMGQRPDQAAGLVTRHVLAEKNRQGQRVLLVEDNPVGQKLAVVIPRPLLRGCRRDGRAGARAVRRRYHAVLMDVQMPRWSI
jgi:hypothetical protein